MLRPSGDSTPDLAPLTPSVRFLIASRHAALLGVAAPTTEPIDSTSVASSGIPAERTHDRSSSGFGRSPTLPLSRELSHEPACRNSREAAARGEAQCPDDDG